MALTRAQRFCFIMCPLDMKGIIGAATVVGCLQHGVGICDERSTLFDYVIGVGVLSSHFRVGYEACIGFMVGKDIGSNARREVNGEVTCEQERVSRSSY